MPSVQLTLFGMNGGGNYVSCEIWLKGTEAFVTPKPAAAFTYAAAQTVTVTPAQCGWVAGSTFSKFSFWVYIDDAEAENIRVDVWELLIDSFIMETGIPPPPNPPSPPPRPPPSPAPPSPPPPPPPPPPSPPSPDPPAPTSSPLPPSPSPASSLPPSPSPAASPSPAPPSPAPVVAPAPPPSPTPPTPSPTADSPTGPPPSPSPSPPSPLAAAPPPSSPPAPLQQPSPPPSPLIIVATFRSYSLGCFAFDISASPSLRALPVTLAANDAAMTVDKCAGLTQAAGLDHYGLTNGHTCVGGVSRPQATQHGSLPESACDRPCPGDARQTCGGGPTDSAGTQLSAMSLYSFNPASPPPRPPPRAPRNTSRPAKPPRPPAPAPPPPSPPSPSRQVETRALIQMATVDLPALQKDVSRIEPIPSARGLILLQPSAVPIFSARAGPTDSASAGVLDVPVIATAHVGQEGRLLAFGSEAMLTSCCGQQQGGGAAAGFDSSELDKIIVNAADWAAAAVTDRKAIIRVADPQLEPVARFIVAMLPDTFVKARQGYLMPLPAFARGGKERCDVYIVLGADPQQRYNAKIGDALRAFMEQQGKGILLTGPLVVDAGLALAAPVPSDEWTRPELMFGKQNAIATGGAARAVAASRVTATHFREMLSRLLEIKDNTASAEFTSLRARVASVRRDIDVSDIGALDAALQARIAEYDRDLGGL
ncbi:hypothetical protein HXX76_010769 [Chlamydomonas incerta]|uniref:WSC domain-containing protein n=1 Tax=Chlamydomonas incerta TaxID=51695 RepID=A0A835SM48_CHLIN|nr:hypothetical protein HXX76_010769 [Chlamydomonas incerta]|eukprot:KAG2429534.1 hypothetical protein HXX76_010769 [Chlamydomonas incerta]